MARDLNRAGYELIRTHEGLRLLAYDDLQPKLKLTAQTKIKGTLTIGIGHTGSLAAIGRDGAVAWNTRITEAEAEKLFRQDVDEAEGEVEGYITCELNENEFAALVSFTYNCGLRNLQKLAGRRLNRNGDRLATAEAMKLYVKDRHGKKQPGLVARRADECALFLRPTGAAARATATRTPDDVQPSASGAQKAQAAAVAGGVTVGGGATLWDRIVAGLKDVSEWTWGLPETIGTVVIVGAVGAAVWLWWRSRRRAKAA